MESFSVTLQPQDSRCRYWAKLITADQPLPVPENVQGADDVSVPYLRRGDEELVPGDVLLTGEERHHRRNRGWSYSLLVATLDGELLEFHSGFSEQKAEMKEQGMPPHLLKGAGDIAAMIRIVHGIRMGMTVTPS